MSLFKRKPLDAKDVSNKISLYIAEGEYAKLEEWLKHPLADLNAPASKVGEIPLRFAILWGRPQAFDMLLEYGADPVFADQYKSDTPLIYLAAMNSHTITKKLIEMKFDLNVTSKDGNTPLHGAARAESGDTVRLLLDAGADPNIKNNNSSNPADIASDRGYHRLADEIRAHASFRHYEISQEWQLNGNSEIAHVQEKKELGLVITEIFNFSQKSYMNIVFNVQAKAQSHITKTFDELRGSTLVEDAAEQMKARGVILKAPYNGMAFDK